MTDVQWWLTGVCSSIKDIVKYCFLVEVESIGNIPQSVRAADIHTQTQAATMSLMKLGSQQVTAIPTHYSNKGIY